MPGETTGISPDDRDPAQQLGSQTRSRAIARKCTVFRIRTDDKLKRLVRNPDQGGDPDQG
jgi:hypothetical protein